MAKSVTARTRRPSPRKVAHTFRLVPEKITAAQRILGTASATETIETALDMIVFRQKLIAGTAAMRGVDILSSEEEDM